MNNIDVLFNIQCPKQYVVSQDYRDNTFAISHKTLKTLRLFVYPNRGRLLGLLKPKLLNLGFEHKIS